MVEVPVGTRIRFLKTLDCPPTGDHPAFLFAVKGDTGRVVSHDCAEGHWVVRDSCPTPFGAVAGDEFEAITDDDEEPE